MLDCMHTNLQPQLVSVHWWAAGLLAMSCRLAILSQQLKLQCLTGRLNLVPLRQVTPLQHLWSYKQMLGTLEVWNDANLHTTPPHLGLEWRFVAIISHAKTKDLIGLPLVFSRHALTTNH